MSQKTLDARTAAALTIQSVIYEKRSLNDVMQNPPFKVPEKDLGLWRELSFGVIRWYWPLAAHANSLLRQPLKNKDMDVYCLILVGIYQLTHLRTATHAAVNETVNSVSKLKKKWARSLVNALLRQSLRQKTDSKGERPAVTAQPDQLAETHLSHPLWLLTQWQQAWPDHWVDIAEANNARPSMTLRVNPRKISRDDYLSQLHDARIAGHVIDDLPNAIVLESPVAVAQLPGYPDGMVSVQDAGAQRAAALLQAEPGNRVLDACSAPGGKCCYLLETADDLDMTALDVSQSRLRHVRDELNRLDLDATLTAADARDTDAWWKGQTFDRILIDAPCSGTGVISRHPDIKHLRRPDDIAQNTERQSGLLAALWPLLAPGGRLVYATCSLQPEENEQIVQQFMDGSTENDGDSATIRTIDTPGTIGRPPGYQCLPTADGHDGFFYAVLERC